MYLLDRDGDQLRLTKFSDIAIPPYAILSHTWGSDEVSFEDVHKGSSRKRAGYEKVAFCLQRAAIDGLRYCWIDTCCIDQTKPAEVQSAIDRMFRWYRQAEKCYVYLSDVPAKAFENSRWFTRGWTLQELIAPEDVHFFSSDGTPLGSKKLMIRDLERITRVPLEELQRSHLSAFTFDERLKWIRGRSTKHEEDMAYSLFGILDVSVSLYYGEGRENAFARLRQQCDGGSLDEAARKCLHAWRLTDPRDDRSRILATKDPLLEASCDWVFRDAAFEKWWTTDDAPILWIHGDPGKGKTMIMTALIDGISQRLKGIPRQSVLSFFFCQDTVRDLSNATAIVRGLTFLLAEKNPSLRSHAIRKHDVAGQKLFEGPNALHSMWAVLMEMAQDPLISKLYLLVDALDECDMASLQDFLSLLAHNALKSKIKWVLSSRNIAFIGEQLTSQQLSHDTSLEVNSSHVASAVTSLIDLKVGQLTTQKGYSEDLKSEVEKCLKARSESTFLWVALVCKELEKAPVRRVRKVLERLPAGLEPLYLRMLQQLEADDNQEDVKSCKSILRAVTTAYRPLDQEELGFLAGLDDCLAADFQTMNDLIRSCGSFLVMREHKVYFVHQSARDFFTTGNGNSIFQFGHEEAHRELTKRLLKTTSTLLKKDICRTGRPNVMLEDISTELVTNSIPLHLQYACCYWVMHVIDGRLLDTDIQLVEAFLDQQFLFWLEALSILERVVDALRGITELLDLLGSRRLELSSQNAELSSRWVGLQELLRDCQQFARASQTGIEQAPLQVYSSALIFAPYNSLVRQRYSKHLPSWIKSFPKVREEWSACLQTFECHYDTVSNVLFSPDGLTVAAASMNGGVKLWDTATSSVRITSRGSSFCGVTALAFLANQQLVACEFEHNAVSLRQFTMDSVYTRTHESDEFYWVTAATFSPDGQMLAYGCLDGTIGLWDVARGPVRKLLKDHTNLIKSMAFSPDGQMIASVSNDQTVKLWDIAKGSLQETLGDHHLQASAVVFSSDGQMVASGYVDGTIILWSSATGTAHAIFEGNSVAQAIAFSSDGQMVVAGLDDGTIRLWDVATGSAYAIFEGHAAAVTAVVFSPDGQVIASGCMNSTVRLWDERRKSAHDPLHSNLFEPVKTLTFSTDGNVVASASGNDLISIWDSVTGSLLEIVLSSTGNYVLRFTQDGSLHREYEVGDPEYYAQGVVIVHTVLPRYPWVTVPPAKCDVLIKGPWIVWAGENLLWLPHEYRSVVQAVAVFGSRLAWGRTSGFVTIIEFDTAKLPPKSR